jgi:tartrate-resistant acid phosphatase type 5
MTRALFLCCGVLATLVACADDGSATTSTTPASQPDPTTGATSADPPATTGGTPASPTSSGDVGSESMTASQGTSLDPATTTPDPSTTKPDTTTTPDPDTTDPSGDDTTTTGGPVEAGTVRFVAIGDTGEGNEDQYMVAEAIVNLCARKGCDFSVMLGDNFYDSGVDGVDDPQWQDKVELPYIDFTFPLYAVLGNHDYGGNGIGVDFNTSKPDYQVEYTALSEIWRMPDKYYSFKEQHAEFWGLDTNQVMTDPINGDAGPQQDWLEAGLAASTATWKIAFGHHPYISNGDHGNAGAYENLEGIPLPFVTGENVKEFMEEAVCGKVDVYICGHDHNIQWLEPKCGTEFIVSGAGSKSEGLPGQNPAYFGMPETEGFIWVELKDSSFTGTFYDKTGAELYSKTIMK